MAGQIEEPLRFNLQADLLHSGSISFGRFESESLSWERRSSFSHNRYLEEVERYSKPGSVTEKKAYFEAHFRRKALLKQNSSENQDGTELPTSENDDPHEFQEPRNANESTHSSCHFKYDEETDTQKCLMENVETLCAEHAHSGSHVICFDESICNLEYEGGESMINNLDHMVTDPEDLKLEETHQTETTNVVLVKSEESTKMTLNDTVAMVSPASEKKQPKPKLKAHVQRIIASEASTGSAKTATRENKGLSMKEKEKKSPRPASPIVYPGRKTSKSEELITSFPKAKLLPQSKSIVKEHKSEKTLQIKSSVSDKSLPGACQTANRTKQTIVTPSKPHANNQSAAGFTLKSDQRAERRKEEKRAAAEMTQSRKSLNFKATPMPPFYKEFAHCPDQSKVISSSKIPNRPRTASMASTTKRFPSNSTTSSNPRPTSSNRRPTSSNPRPTSSNPRPTSSTSSTTRNRLIVPPRSIQEKKKDLNSQKQGQRARDTKGVHMGSGQRLGYIAVGVAT